MLWDETTGSIERREKNIGDVFIHVNAWPFVLVSREI
jgi:hypothetical protein